jgi:hypothetical protein
MAKGSVGTQTSRVIFAIPRLNRSLLKVAINEGVEPLKKARAKPVPPVPPLKYPLA